jgi:phosphoribosylanthranilate isomerase
MITQIYEISCVEDALLMVSLGVDHLGLVVSEQPGKREGWVNIKTAQEIVATVGSQARKVLIPIASDLEEMIQMAEAVKPDILQLMLHTEEHPQEVVKELRKRLPQIAIMETIPLAGPETRQHAVKIAHDFEAVVDYFIIDTIGEKGVGTTGILNDWTIGREIVEMVKIPVILAGGLSPDNVAAAIRAVRPWGVDSMSHTNLPGSRSRKDAEKVRRFVAEAHKAAVE